MNFVVNRRSIREITVSVFAAILIGLGGCAGDKTPDTATGNTAPSSVQVSDRHSVADNLLAAREGFTTRLLPSSYEPDGPADEPPEGIFELVKYESPVGELVAYVTPDPNDGKRHPAVLWAHGGFGGIGSWFWEDASPQNDQTASAFREAGIVLMLPSWRGENDNPGNFELFFGEVNDLLAARDYLAGLPYVDPERIYLAGHSSGGTMTLLGVTASDRFRAAFSFGGAPDIERVVSNGRGYGNTPFDYRSAEEGRLRSAIHFVKAIETPTFYFEGSGSSYSQEALVMEQLAERENVPFTACIIQGGDHFNILAPITTFLARQILEDSGTDCQIAITSEQANEVFQQAMAEYRQRRAAAIEKFPIIELAPDALTEVKETARSQSFDLSETYFRVDRSSSGWQIGFTNTYDPAVHEKLQQDGLTILVPKASLADVRGYVIDFVDHGGRGGFVFRDRFTE